MLVAAGLVGSAQAGALVDGDAKAGETKAAACVACHGPGGNSLSPTFPKLAGQGAPYIVKQLGKFKSGERVNPVMQPQAANLSDQDMQDLAAYFSTQKPSMGAASPDLVAAGEKIYRAGLKDEAVPACMGCHGPKGDGNAAAAYPRIGGQQAAYVEAQLQAYRAGTRKAPMMSKIVAHLNDEQIRALASYVSGLH
jgi:cytochrome c553